MRVGELQIFIGLLLHSRAQVKTHLLRSVTLLALLISFPFDSLNAEDGDLTMELVSFGPVQETRTIMFQGKETRMPGPERKLVAVILKITPNKAQTLLELSRSKVRGQLSTGAEADYVGFTQIGTTAKVWLTPHLAAALPFVFDRTQINWPDPQKTQPTEGTRYVALDLSGENKSDRFVYEFAEANRSSMWALFFDALPTQLAVIYCNGTSIKLVAN